MKLQVGDKPEKLAQIKQEIEDVSPRWYGCTLLNMCSIYIHVLYQDFNSNCQQFPTNVFLRLFKYKSNLNMLDLVCL